ncbi:uncharacterized protein V1518DRAFT_416805 [Limtongia smithiae]|uniref:uncharacterized protein n=1 Tax=Limtongia smithiae TaxID=1125753 RepID=UPI0034CE650C
MSSSVYSYVTSAWTATETETSSTSTPTQMPDYRSPGNAQANYGQSLSTFISSLTASLIVFGLELWVFAIVRKRIRRVYEPKTYAVPKRQRVSPTGRGLIDWIVPTLFMPESEFIQKCGLDAYFFMRYLAMLIFIFVIAAAVVLPILLPMNSANTSSGSARGLDKLAWVNVGAEATGRYWVHLVLAIAFVAFLLAVFRHELAAYVRMRQKYLISPHHQLRASATTVLVRAVPNKLLDPQRMREVFDVFPGGVRNVWFVRNVTTLSNKVAQRDSISTTLEAAETTLLQTCTRAHKVWLAKNAKHSTAPEELPTNAPDNAVWRKYIPESKRPRHRVSNISWMPAIPLPGLSHSVDSIDYCKEQLSALNLEIADMQKDETVYPYIHSCFIQFNMQIAAHMACQTLASEAPEYMVHRMVEIDPADIVWSNMRIRWAEAQLRSWGVFFTTAALIIGWAFPVAFVGIISQLSYLTSALPFLDFLNDLPAAIKGIIAGVLPPAAVAVLMALLPLILRVFAYVSGVATGVHAELKVQNTYFAFLFVQVFLVITIASSITTVIQQLTNNPTSIPELLAQNLPKAANFFFSYLILQGLAVSAAALLRIGPLVMIKILGPILDSTARQKFERITTLTAVEWGTFYPIYTNLGAIAIVYTIIAPLIIPISLIAFSLFYISYRYQFIYCNYSPIDSSGLYFPRAIHQLFTGVYVMELCLIGLFFLVRDEELRASCTPHAVIMIIVLLVTVVYQNVLRQSFAPLLTYLPVTLATHSESTGPLVLSGPDRLKVDTTSSEAEMPLLPQSPPSARSYSAVSYGSTDYKYLPNGSNGDVATTTESPGSASSAPPGQLERSSTHSGAVQQELIESPIAHLFSTFRKPIKYTLDTVQDHLPELHTPSVSEQLRLGNNKRIKNITGLIYTGNNAEALESELLRNSKDRMLLEGVAEDLEDLPVEEREYRVRRAFTHASLRSKAPIVWIPEDELGVAQDEIARTAARFGDTIAMSSAGASLDLHANVTFVSRPPDYDIKSKIAL